MCHANGFVEDLVNPSKPVIWIPKVIVASRHLSLKRIENSSVRLDTELIVVILVRISV